MAERVQPEACLSYSIFQATLRVLDIVAVVDAAVRIVSASCYRWYVFCCLFCCREGVRFGRVNDEVFCTIGRLLELIACNIESLRSLGWCKLKIGLIVYRRIEKIVGSLPKPPTHFFNTLKSDRSRGLSHHGTMSFARDGRKDDTYCSSAMLGRIRQRGRR